MSIASPLIALAITVVIGTLLFVLLGTPLVAVFGRYRARLSS